MKRTVGLRIAPHRTMFLVVAVGMLVVGLGVFAWQTSARIKANGNASDNNVAAGSDQEIAVTGEEIRTNGLADPLVFFAPSSFTTTLSGLAENPPTGSAGTGTVTVTMDPAANTLTVNATFSGLTGNTTAAHIHCCTAAPGNVGVATQTPSFIGFPLGVTSGAFSNTYDTTLLSTYSAVFVTANGGTAAGAEAALFAGLSAGQAYFNIHTSTSPGGEIRGFLIPPPIVVNTTTQQITTSGGVFATNGQCSLQEAIITADSIGNAGATNPHPDCVAAGAGNPVTITLQAGATYAVTQRTNFLIGSNNLSLPFIRLGTTANPVVLSGANIIIEGNGATIDNNGENMRLFSVDVGGSLTLRDLVLKDGLAQGGDGGSAAFGGGGGGLGAGGAIFNRGDLTVERCTFTNNQGIGGNGGNNIAGLGNGGSGGGGFFGDGGDSRNGQGGGGGGGGATGNGGDSGTSDPLEAGAGGGGGGTAAGGVDGTTFMGSPFGGNGGIQGGGSGGTPPAGIGANGGSQGGGGGGGSGGSSGGNGGNGNYGGGGGGGGAGSLNTVGGAGGFGGGGGSGASSVSGIVLLPGGNGGFGGGGGAGSPVGSGGTFGGAASSSSGGGGAGLGGAIFNDSGTVTIRNSTFSGNTATAGTGGAGGANSRGGAIFSHAGTLTILNSTVSGNTAASNGALSTSNSTDVTLRNTIIANNGAAQCQLSGGTNVGSGNLIMGSVNCPGVAVVTDPNLAALTLNAPGLTPTMAITNTSSAFNAADAATSLATDQRGIARPQLGGFDIGAFERNNFPPTITAAAGVTRQQGSSSANLQIATVSDVETPEASLTVTSAPLAGSGVTVSGIAVDASGNVTANVSANCTATTSTFTLTVTDGGGSSTQAILTVTVPANTQPVLTYNNPAPIIVSGSTAVAPATGLTDNGSISSVVVQNQGTYTGGIFVSPAGNVFIFNALVVGTHTITIRATDNCGLIRDASFNLTVVNPVLNGSGGGDIFVVTKSGANTVVTQNNTPIFSAPTASFNLLTINGLGGNDSLTVNASGGNPFPTNGISFDGGADDDSMTILGGSWATEVSTPTGPGSGSLVYSGGATGAATLAYANIEPITDTSVVTNFTINGTNGADTINIVNGPGGTTQVNSGAIPTFELVNFANKTNVAINALIGVDVVTVNFTAVPAALTTLSINSGSSSDEVDVLALPAIPSVTLIDTAIGVPGDRVVLGSTFATFNTGTGTLANILGPVSVNDSGGVGELYVDRSGQAAAANVVVTGTTITGAGPSSITYIPVNIPVVQLSLGAGADVIDVTSTSPVTAVTINGGAGNDIFNMTGAGINGFNTFNGDADNDTFNVSPSLNGAINVNGGLPTPSFGDVINVDQTGVTGGVLAINAAGTGTFTSTSHQTINITGIEPRPTSTAVTSSANPSVFGQPVTFTATVSSPAAGPTITGTVQFVVDGSNFGVPVAVNFGVAGISSLTTGSHTVTVQYSGDSNYAASTGTLAGGQTVNKANTTASVLSDSPDPTVTGQSYTVGAGVTVNLPGFGIPQGTITVTDGTNNCTITLPATSCILPSTSAGAKTLTATYNGDTNFNASPPSAGAAHTVNKANTTASVLSDSPDPTVTGQSYTVGAGVTVNSPGAGTPTGTITVTDGTSNCTITLPAASCLLPNTSAGAKTLTATYNGDTNFNASPPSAGAAHTVNKADTTITITNTAALALVSNVDTPYAVNWSVSVTSPGAGTPTGTVTVTDGTVSCTAAVLVGTCDLIPTTPGVKTITATYAGDTNFNGSVSQTVPHSVQIGITGNVKQFGTNANLAGVTITLSGSAAAVTVTDVNGNYAFSIPVTGGSYLLTPSGLSLTYEPITRSYTNVTTNITNADFTAYTILGAGMNPRNVRVQNTNTIAGNVVDVPVVVTSRGNEASFSFSLNYDTAVMGTPTVACGSNVTGCTLAVNTTQPGRVGIRIVPTAVLTAGMKEIAKVTFQTFANNLVSTPVSFGDTPLGRDIRNAEGNPLPALYHTGFVTFTQGSQGLEGDIVDANGTPAGGDGVKANDVTIISQMVLGNIPGPVLTPNQFQRADVNGNCGNGAIDAGDVTVTSQYSLGNLQPLAACGPTVPVIIPSRPETTDTVGRIIRAVSTNGVAGQTVTVPIIIESQGNEASISYTITFPQATLSNPQVALGSGVPGGTTFGLNTSQVATGKLGVLVATANTYAAGTRQMITVTFNIAAGATPGNYPVGFSSTPVGQSVSAAQGGAIFTDVTYEAGNVVLGATAAAVEVSGRVTTPDGRGLRNATVTMTDENGNRRTATTGTFGSYRFEDVEAGKTYVVTVASQRYRFASKVVNATDHLMDVDFVGQE